MLFRSVAMISLGSVRSLPHRDSSRTLGSGVVRKISDKLAELVTCEPHRAPDPYRSQLSAPHQLIEGGATDVQQRRGLVVGEQQWWLGRSSLVIRRTELRRCSGRNRAGSGPRPVVHGRSRGHTPLKACHPSVAGHPEAHLSAAADQLQRPDPATTSCSGASAARACLDAGRQAGGSAERAHWRAGRH